MNDLQSPSPNPKSRGRSPLVPVIISSGALSVFGLIMAWITYSRRTISHRVPMVGALDGELKWFKSHGRDVAYYIGGQAKRGLSLTGNTAPLLFIHSINAAASAYEMKPLYDHFARDRRVYAIDLPGFGFSDRSDRRYSPELYYDAINTLIEKELNGGPVDAVALSLGGEMLAQAAALQPKFFRTLSFISPTGMSQADRMSRANDTLLSFTRQPLWRTPLFDLLTVKPSITFFLKQSLRRPVNRGLINYAYITAHQPDAANAPLHFLAGKLFTPTIFETYLSLKQPSLLVYGRDAFVGFDRVDELRRQPNWKINAFEGAGGLVHWDDPNAVIGLLEKHLG